MKLPWIKFFQDDWLRDTCRLSPQARGIWIDIIAHAQNEPERGIYERSRDEFCRELRLDQANLIDVLTELANVASVTASNEKITVMSRRMVRDAKRYKNNAIRQARHRRNTKSNAQVTPQTLDVRRLDAITSKRLTANVSPLASPSPSPSPDAPATATAPLAPVYSKEGVYLPWDMPESERMTPEEMNAIKQQHLGQRPKSTP